MNIDLAQVPKWIFAVAVLIFVAILFYALVWPGVPVTLGRLGTFGKGEKTSLTLSEIESLKTVLARLHLHSQSLCLDNPDTNYRLCFESDGDLVVYDRSRSSSGTSNGTPVWGSGRPK